MITKTLRFDNDVLDVLRQADIRQDNGTWLLVLRSQLERGLYLQVNKALETMGGKWNRKVGGHVFSGDPRLQVEGLVDEGTLTVELDGFFETPWEVIDRMFYLVTPMRPVLEPSAGLGAIANALVEFGISKQDIFCVEKNQDRAAELSRKEFITRQMDFLTLDTWAIYKTIFMNPPFERGQDIDHVRHAYEFLRPGGRLVSVMSEGAFFREDRKAAEFREWLAEVGHSEKLPEGSFKASGTMINARLVVIER